MSEVFLGMEEEAGITKADLERIIVQSNRSRSKIALGIWGKEDTLKTGLALDCRTDDEIEKGMKVLVIDFDGNSPGIKSLHYHNDPNIIIYEDFTYINQDGSINYLKTIQTVKAIVREIKTMDMDMVKAVVIEGMDKLLKYSEYAMKEKVEKEYEDRVDYNDWTIRNRHHHEIFLSLLRLPCWFICTTHEEPKKEYVYDPESNKRVLQTVDICPSWLHTDKEKVIDYFWQVLRTSRESIAGRTEFSVTVSKSKTNPSIYEKKFPTMDVEDSTGEYYWYGLWDLLKACIKPRLINVENRRPKSLEDDDVPAKPVVAKKKIPEPEPEVEIIDEDIDVPAEPKKGNRKKKGCIPEVAKVIEQIEEEQPKPKKEEKKDDEDEAWGW